MITDEMLNDMVAEMRRAHNDLQDVEVKASVGKLPKSLPETISAFANGSGGTVVLGLSEERGFTPAEGFNAKAAFDGIAELCSDKLTPPVRADVRIASFEGSLVVVANIPETLPMDKPCYVTERGRYRGSFVRTGDGDRLLSQYEIDRLVENRRQPRHDLEIVDGATLDDLDADLVSEVLRSQRSLHPRVFGKMSDDEILRALRIMREGDDGRLGVTLAGLLALGTYPQGFYPRLTVTFACYPGVTKAQAGGVKFVDSMTMAGPVPVVLSDTVDAVRRNMRIGGVLVGAFRYDVPDYPLDAVRELVCNAIMHRDYSPMGRGSQIQVNLYADRLEVLSPGGLFGGVTVDALEKTGVSATRNQFLSALLEAVPYERGFVAENRGTGFLLIGEALQAALMAPPEIKDSPSWFSVTLHRRDEIPDRSEFAEAGTVTNRELVVDGAKAGKEAPGESPLLAASPAAVGLADVQTFEAHDVSGKASASSGLVGISAADRIAGYLESAGQARPAELVRELGISRSTVAYALKRMMKQGIVELVPFAGGSTSATNPRRSYRLRKSVAA